MQEQFQSGLRCVVYEFARWYTWIMSAGHNHTHRVAKQTLRLAFFLTIVILLAELVGGLIANSLALLSDASHVVTDLFALGLAWFALMQGERPANARKTFGYHRVGI